MIRKHLLWVFAGAVVGLAPMPQGANAAPIDVDITYVIDRSGSMGGEFSFLGSAISGFLTDLEADSRIGTARAGLVTYLSGARLEQDLTTDASALEAAFNDVSASGSIENAYNAIDAAIPNGNNPSLITNYGTNTVKSTILITDEDADDAPGYSNGFATSSSAGDLMALLEEEGFLNNVIYDVGGSTSEDNEMQAIARPSGAYFDISTFRDNREQFFADFTAAKIREITTTVPAPGTLGLMAIALIGLAAAGRGMRSQA
jgi:hypothetical protein